MDADVRGGVFVRWLGIGILRGVFCVRDAEGARRAVRSAAEHGSKAYPGAARPRTVRPPQGGRRAGARPDDVNGCGGGWD
ncbi:hypothetical protein AT05_03895 [Schleiferia thermophila str. Yellowstone]|nr:hypothetical protein AT05_03895 [Schleiferia thermophila str. Yellowstone]